jgi:hypothetical protein
MLEEKHEIKIDFQNFSWDEIEKNSNEDHQIDIRRAYIRTYLTEDPETIERLSQEDAFKSLRDGFLMPFEKQYFNIVKPKSISFIGNFESGRYQGHDIDKLCRDLGFEKLFVQLYRSFVWYENFALLDGSMCIVSNLFENKKDWDYRITSEMYKLLCWHRQFTVITESAHPLLFLRAMINASNPYLYLTALCATLYTGRIDLFDALIKDFKGHYAELLRPHYHSFDGLTVRDRKNTQFNDQALSFENVSKWNVICEDGFTKNNEFQNWTFSDYARNSNTTDLFDICVKRHQLANTPENPAHFIWACYVGDYETISRFIEQYKVPSSEDDLTPLVACALSHQAEDPRIIKKLLEQPESRAKLHKKALETDPPLIIAMRMCKTEMVRNILLASEDSELMEYTAEEIGQLQTFVKNHLKNTPVLNAILFVAKINRQNPNIESIPKPTIYDRMYSQDNQERFLDKNGVSLARDYLLEIESEKKRASALHKVDETSEKTANSKQHGFAKFILLHHYNGQSGFLSLFRKPEVTSITVNYKTYKEMKDTKRKAKSGGDERKDCAFQLNDRNTDRSAVRDDQSTKSSENFGPRFRKVLDLSKDGKTLTCFFANPKQHQFFADKLKAYQAIGTQASDDSTLVDAKVLPLRYQSLSAQINQLCEFCLTPGVKLDDKTAAVEILISYAPGIVAQHLTPDPTLIVKTVLNLLKDSQFDKNLSTRLISALSLQKLFSKTPFQGKDASYLDKLYSHCHSTRTAEAYLHIMNGTDPSRLSEDEKPYCLDLLSHMLDELVYTDECLRFPLFMQTEAILEHFRKYNLTYYTPKSSNSNMGLE